MWKRKCFIIIITEYFFYYWLFFTKGGEVSFWHNFINKYTYRYRYGIQIKYLIEFMSVLGRRITIDTSFILYYLKRIAFFFWHKCMSLNVQNRSLAGFFFYVLFNMQINFFSLIYQSMSFILIFFKNTIMERILPFMAKFFEKPISNNLFEKFL